MVRKIPLIIILVVLVAVISVGLSKFINNTNENLKVVPIKDAGMILKWGGKVVYVDPVGGVSAFAGQPTPDLILLTDTHSGRLSMETLHAVAKPETVIISPMAVADLMPNAVAGTLLVMKNGEKTNEKTKQKVNLRGFFIEAIPMYNLSLSKDAYLTSGDGNGYVLKMGGKRVQISVDPNTEMVLLN